MRYLGFSEAPLTPPILTLLQLFLFGFTTMSRSDWNKSNLSPAGAVVSLAIGVNVCGCSIYFQDTILSFKTLSRH